MCSSWCFCRLREALKLLGPCKHSLVTPRDFVTVCIQALLHQKRGRQILSARANRCTCGAQSVMGFCACREIALAPPLFFNSHFFANLKLTKSHPLSTIVGVPTQVGRRASLDRQAVGCARCKMELSYQLWLVQLLVRSGSPTAVAMCLVSRGWERLMWQLATLSASHSSSTF